MVNFYFNFILRDSINDCIEQSTVKDQFATWGLVIDYGGGGGGGYKTGKGGGGRGVKFYLCKKGDRKTVTC